MCIRSEKRTPKSRRPTANIIDCGIYGPFIQNVRCTRVKFACFKTHPLLRNGTRKMITYFTQLCNDWSPLSFFWRRDCTDGHRHPEKKYFWFKIQMCCGQSCPGILNALCAWCLVIIWHNYSPDMEKNYFARH